MGERDLMDEARALRQSVNWGSNESVEAIARALAAAEQRGREEERQFVEQAFRDGIAYASNVEVTDIDEAWRSSKAYHAAIRRGTP